MPHASMHIEPFFDPVTGTVSYVLADTDAGQAAVIDPVLDFLVNRKEGHCEYFASALALLLRSVDVPARLVNGFKGEGSRSSLPSSSLLQRRFATSSISVPEASLTSVA